MHISKGFVWWFIVIIVVLLVVSCGGANEAENDVAAEAIENYMLAVMESNERETWNAIHPYERAELDEAHYLSCQQPEALPKIKIEITEVEDVGEFVLSSGQTVKGTKRVVAELTLGEETFIRPAHAIPYEDAYYISLINDVFEAYVAGECP